MSVAAGAPDPNDPRRRLKGFLPKDLLEEARRIMEETGETDLSKVLLSMKLMDDRSIRQARAQEMGMAFVDLDRVRPDQLARESLSVDLTRELRVLPVKRDGNTLWLAMDEADPDRVAKVKEATGLRVVPVLCLPAALDDALEALG